LPPGPYTVTVLDLLGRAVQPALPASGGTRVALDAGRLSKGAYLVRVQGAHFNQVLPLVRN
ncbi:hypothetical protein, partial [Hymenobacter coccineus]|uniref:hypothetical protein n=1 Tax=Hymenobacter coccineus TaxID=1908235 RepID=UPI0013012CB9